MTEIEPRRRRVEVIADTVADTVTPAATAALALAATVTRNPELGFLSVPIGALSGALSKQGAILVIEALQDRAHRVDNLLEQIGEQAGTTYENFVDEHVDSDPKRRLLGSVVADATDATTLWKLQILAKAFVRGARDEARIEETLYFVARVKPLDPGHARILAVAAARQQRGIQRTSFTDVNLADPGIGLAAALLGNDLIERGLLTVAREEPNLAVALTEVGTAVSSWLADLGASTEATLAAPPLE